MPKKVVTVSYQGNSVEIPLPAWEVLMQAINQMIDSGDLLILDDDITKEDFDAAGEASSDLFLLTNPDPLPASATDTPEDPPMPPAGRT